MNAGGRARPGIGAATDRSPRDAQAVDLEVGRRVRRRRLEMGLTQGELAELAGVTYQQLYKYETGSNRVSAGRLHRIAQALGVDVGHFFADDDPVGHDWAGVNKGQRRMLLELVRHVAAIRDPRQREALCRLARELASPGAGADPPVERPGPPPEPQSGPDR